MTRLKLFLKANFIKVQYKPQSSFCKNNFNTSFEVFLEVLGASPVKPDALQPQKAYCALTSQL